MASTNIRATCACKAFSLNFSLPNAMLPIPRALCLCNSCRKVSGSCGNSYIALPESIAIDPSAHDLRAYNTSDDLIRYFCPTCGAHIFVYQNATKVWWLATGIWDKTEAIIDWTGCKWVSDTIDGGVSVWFNEREDDAGGIKQSDRWMYNDLDGELVPEGTHENPPARTQNTAHIEVEKLKASCHCGNVRFNVTRPNAKSEKVYSPFPDLMVPYSSGISAENPEHEPWFLRDNNKKYLAGTCVCPSCRHALGFEIQTWAFIPRCNIFLEDDQPLDLAVGNGPWQRYESSDGVHREFCGTCGSNVFWHCDERPELIDVSIGLFDSEKRARVEDWLDWWTERVSFRELGVSESLIKTLEKGLKAWGKPSRE